MKKITCKNIKGDWEIRNGKFSMVINCTRDNMPCKGVRCKEYVNYENLKGGDPVSMLDERKRIDSATQEIAEASIEREILVGMLKKPRWFDRVEKGENDD